MNQRSQIATIFADKTLNNAEKSQLIQNIRNNSTPQVVETIITQPQEPLHYCSVECTHYTRRCLSYCRMCKLYFKCRLCHDQIITTHKLERFEIRKICCEECHLIQKPSNLCRFCRTEFSSYFCDICHLWSGDSTVWHCNKCGICRKGGQENFFHCDTCNLCLVNSKKNSRHHQVLGIENKGSEESGYFIIVYNTWKSERLPLDVSLDALTKACEKNDTLGKIAVTQLKNGNFLFDFLEETNVQLLSVEEEQHSDNRIGAKERVTCTIQQRHVCVNNTSDSNCSVCSDYMFSSTLPLHISKCGHTMHTQCFAGCIQNQKYTCPLCRKMMIDMTVHWQYLEKMIQETPLPAEYADWTTDILCNDCVKQSSTKFHFHGHKCQECRSFNTSILKINKSTNK